MYVAGRAGVLQLVYVAGRAGVLQLVYVAGRAGVLQLVCVHFCICWCVAVSAGLVLLVLLLV